MLKKEEDKNKIIQETIILMLKLMDFNNYELETKDYLENTNELVFNIKTKNNTDSSFLIGQKGINLRSFQHLVRLLVSKKIQEKIRFIVDVNNYIQENNQRLIQQTQMAVDEAINKHKTIILPPMTAYQRRLIHLMLEKNNKVTTESTGEGPERKIIIQPKSDIL